MATMKVMDSGVCATIKTIPDRDTSPYVRLDYER